MRPVTPTQNKHFLLFVLQIDILALQLATLTVRLSMVVTSYALQSSQPSTGMHSIAIEVISKYYIPSSSTLSANRRYEFEIT